MNLLIDLHQERRINAASNQATSAQNAAERTRWEIDDLKRRTDALTIACQALWELVRTHSGMNDEMILHKMQEIDARDGKVDGKISTSLAACPACGRNSKAARKCCLYCGAALPVTHVFEKS